MARHRTLLPLLGALALAVLSGCGASDEPVPASGTGAEADAVALVERFMQARKDGLPADEFLSEEARAAYEDHVGGLWLHDDSIPGGPGGEYRDVAIEAAPGPDDAWRVEVRTTVEWDGDAPPSEMVEVLKVRFGAIADARRTDDPEDAGLPLAVAKTRERIYHAGVGDDYDALRSLVDPETFSYSLAEEGDPIGFWRRMEKSEIPILGDILSGVIHTRFGMHEDIYVWPSATSKLPQDWTEADIQSMRDAGYRDRDIRAFEEQIGGYAGWRVGIRSDGTWIYFISGE